MALRLIEMVLQEKDRERLQELLKEFHVLEHRQVRFSDSEILVRILLEAEQSEAVLDVIEKQYAGNEGYRVVILPVEATLPRKRDALPAEAAQQKQKLSERINREELYESIKDAARCSKVYLTMTVLSTVVAAIGLKHNSVAIIIGAMVIATLLGPNIAAAFGATLGDLALLRRALFTNLAGIGTTIVLSIIIGLLVHIDPAITEIALQTRVKLSNFIVALVSGCAGALAFTTGVSAILIGVMVAVALLPPLVAFGMLLGTGLFSLAMGALALFMMNLVCINLAGVITFLVQGIHPATWWEKDRATKATLIAIGLWVVVLLVALGGLLLLSQKGWI